MSSEKKSIIAAGTEHLIYYTLPFPSLTKERQRADRNSIWNIQGLANFGLLWISPFVKLIIFAKHFLHPNPPKKKTNFTIHFSRVDTYCCFCEMIEQIETIIQILADMLLDKTLNYRGVLKSNGFFRPKSFRFKKSELITL